MASGFGSTPPVPAPVALLQRGTRFTLRQHGDTTSLIADSINSEMLALRLPLTPRSPVHLHGVRKCQDCPAKKL
jgi:hypothetical protein